VRENVVQLELFTHLQRRKETHRVRQREKKDSKNERKNKEVTNEKKESSDK